MTVKKKKYFKFSLGLVLCLFWRLIPFRAPNIEPIMATMMPFSKAYGALVGSLFAFLSILSYDIVTGTLGLQTFFTIFAYSLLGFWATFYFKKREPKARHFVTFAVLGTLFFDAFTGLTIGPIFFHQPFWATLVGQIPFTALHLLGNIVFALMLSPAIYSLLVRKKQTINLSIINSLYPKTI